MHEKAVFIRSHDEVRRQLDSPGLEKHLDTPFLSTSHAVEDGEEGSDDARLVLDQQGRHVFDLETEHISAEALNAAHRTEHPTEDVDCMDRVLEKAPPPA